MATFGFPDLRIKDRLIFLGEEKEQSHRLAISSLGGRPVFPLTFFWIWMVLILVLRSVLTQHNIKFLRYVSRWGEKMIVSRLNFAVFQASFSGYVLPALS
jgi:hypothetical protein